MGRMLGVMITKLLHCSIATLFKFKKGFTLIELLVVISIIGILSSFVTVSLIGSQAKSRDARRKSDLDALKKALELAKTDTAGSSYYPACSSYAISGTGASCNLSTTATTPALSPTYIKEIPIDPKGTGWWYEYNPSPASCDINTCTGYILRACLENGNDPQKENPKAGCTGSTQPASYSTSNP